MDDNVPRKPRLRPGLAVLRRRSGELQVGLDPRHAAVVGGLPESVVAAALHGLRSRCDTEELLARLGDDPAERSALRELLRRLTDLGLIEDQPAGTTVPSRLLGELPAGPPPATRAGQVVEVHGDGRLAVSVACLLAGAGIGRVHVAAKGTVAPEDTGTGYLADDVGRPRLAAAADAIARTDRSVRTTRPGRTHRAELVVLTDAVVPDPDLVGTLVADAVPHLAVHVRDGLGVIGPLVVPGWSSCLQCAHLYRTQADDCWPGIATQLAGAPQLATLACTQATAGFAAAASLEALRWVCSGGERPSTWNTTVEIDPRTASTRYRSWPPHPACPCHGPGQLRR